MTSHNAFFFDGKTAARQDVRVRLTATSLEIARDTSPVLIEWEFHGLRLIDDGSKDGTLRLASTAAPDARIVTADGALQSGLRHAAPQLFVPPFTRLLGTGDGPDETRIVSTCPDCEMVFLSPGSGLENLHIFFIAGGGETIVLLTGWGTGAEQQR